MSDVASLDNCKELYEVSGWHTDEDEGWYYAGMPEAFRGKGTGYGGICPAYNLGFLLRQLPHTQIKLRNFVTSVHLPRWSIQYRYTRNRGEDIQVEADTPEDAAASMAIELFKQSILQKEGV